MDQHRVARRVERRSIASIVGANTGLEMVGTTSPIAFERREISERASWLGM